MKSTRTILSKILVLVIALLCLAPAVKAQDDLLFDHFDGTTLNTGPDGWTFQTNSGNNGYYEVGQDKLTLYSGTTSGAGGFVNSNAGFEVFENDTTTLVFETRAKTSSPDGGAWGFLGFENDDIWDYTDGVAVFSVSPTDGLGVSLRNTSSNPATRIPIPGSYVDITEWHTYRIELSSSDVKFYIDGELRVTHSGNLPISKPLRARLDRVSWGTYQTASFDYVHVYRRQSICSATAIPGGGTITFSSNRNGIHQFYVMDGSECSLLQLTNDSENSRHASAWTLDGSKFAYQSGAFLYTMNADGSNRRKLLTSSFGTTETFPAWSPDGIKLAIQIDIGRQEIFVVNADGTNLRQLTNTPGLDNSAPFWTSDGAQIVFTSNRSGASKLWIMNADGSGQRQLMPDNGFADSLGEVSPDGSKIAFVSNRDGNFEIYVMDSDSSNQIRLTQNGSWNTYPQWSPDGTRILFHSNQSGNNEIYVMMADGSNQTRVTDNLAEDAWAVWGGPKANTPPIANAGNAYNGTEGSIFILDGATASDDGDALSYYWSVNTALCTFSDTTALNPDISCRDNGTYVVNLTVDDNVNDPVSSETTVTVTNVAPTIALSGPASVNEGSTYTLALGAVTDPGDDTVTEYIVHWGDGETETYSTAGNVTHTYVDGPLEPTITVDLVDEDGTHVNAGSLAVMVKNVVPTIALSGPASVDEGSVYTLTLGAVTDPGDDTVTEYIVHWGDGEKVTYSAAADVTHTYVDGPLSPTITVDLVDEDGTHVNAGSLAVMVKNVVPTIALSGPASVDEGSVYTLTLGAVTDPGDDTVTEYIVHWGDGDTVTYTANGDITHTYVDGPSSPTITVDLTDEDGTHLNAGSLAVTANNVAPTITGLTTPDGPVDINDQPVSLSIAFTDPGALDTHEVVWNWGDSSSDVVPGATSATAGSHAYAEAGTYTIEVTVTDKDGGFDSETFEYVVIYDPEGGFVTGGGWILSPEGAYTPDPILTGKANYGFVSKYKKGAKTPTGNTEFQFKAGDLNFHSGSYDWLVVAGAKAKFKGTGTINGSGNYGFMLSAVDAKETPSTDTDLFRIKIWDKDNGDVVVYDNQLGAGDDTDPTTEIGGGNIIVHKAK